MSVFDPKRTFVDDIPCHLPALYVTLGNRRRGLLPERHMRRREFTGLLGGTIFWWPVTARSQQPTKNYTIGFLYPGMAAGAPQRIAAMLSGVRTAGFRESEVQVLTKVTGGDATLLAPMVAELVKRKVDLIFAVSSVAVQAARSETTTIPIVTTDLESDPVDAGLIASVSRPGGNITGVFLDFPDFGNKWLESLRETVPQLKVVGVLWDSATAAVQLKAIEAAATALNIKVEILDARRPADVEGLILSAKERGVGGLLFLSSPIFGTDTKRVADLVLAQRLPAVMLFTDFARNGGLMAYGPNLLAIFRQGGVLAGKILRGEKVADLPIETPTKFEFVLNLKTAKILGINVPQSVLLRADEVIE
jgi:putative tryptophan/tyrosine transport system substrate-binding protein